MMHCCVLHLRATRAIFFLTDVLTFMNHNNYSEKKWNTQRRCFSTNERRRCAGQGTWQRVSVGDHLEVDIDVLSGEDLYVGSKKEIVKEKLAAKKANNSKKPVFYKLKLVEHPHPPLLKCFLPALISCARDMFDITHNVLRVCECLHETEEKRDIAESPFQLP